MNHNKQRIENIDKEIAKLQSEKDRLLEIESLPELEKKIQNYLTVSYSGKKLSEKHAMNETGFWKISGEDPNCDLCGPHHQPDLGVVEGTLKDALIYALKHPNFYTWGGGGDITKINIVKPSVLK
jgi:hypothetical protein